MCKDTNATWLNICFVLSGLLILNKYACTAKKKFNDIKLI